MTPEELHRAVIRAIAFGDAEGEHRLRRRFRGLDHDSAADYLCATAVVCLAHRFGEAAPPDRIGFNRVGLNSVGLDRDCSDRADSDAAAREGVGLDHADSDRADLDRVSLDRDRSDPAGRERIGPDRAVLDHAELGRFMAELRACGPALRPPRNFLEVEAVIRGLRGEPHMIEEIGASQQREALAFVLRYLTDSVPEIREDFDAVIDRSQVLQRRWIIG